MLIPKELNTLLSNLYFCAVEVRTRSYRLGNIRLQNEVVFTKKKKLKLIGIKFQPVEFVLKVSSGAQSPHFIRIWSKSLYSRGTECPEEGGLLGKGTSII